MIFKNLVGLVTGGASGLGKATVERFVKEGGKVTLLDLPTSEGKTVSDKLGPENCCFVPCDITNENEVANALAETKGKVIEIKLWYKYIIFLEYSISNPGNIYIIIILQQDLDDWMRW